MLSAEAKLYLYLGAAWVENHDVLPNPPLTWEYGIEGAGPTDLLASTGFLNAYLDNSRSNSAAKDGLYSPDHANLLANFAKGIKAKVTLPNYGDWEQEFKDDIAAFDTVSPAWDGEVNAVADFDAETDVDGDLNDGGAAAHDGAVGLKITFDDANAAYGTINADAIDQTSGVFSFWINKSDLAIENAKIMNILYAVDGAAAANWRLQIVSGAGLILRGQGEQDGAGADWSTTQHTLTAGWHHILYTFVRSTGVGNDDGWCRIYVDGALEMEKTGIDNDTLDWDTVRTGMIFTNSTTFGGSFYMDTIKIDPVGAPFASKLAAKTGDYGLAIPIIDTTARYVVFTGPNNETVMVAETWIDPKTLAMANATDHIIMLATGDNVGGITWSFYIRLRYLTASGYYIGCAHYTDAGAGVASGYVAITDAPHLVGAEWVVASAPAADDGYLKIYVDGELAINQTGIDNDLRDVDILNMAAPAGLDATTYGIYCMDGCRWSNQLEQVKFIGNISAIRPAAGLFEHPAVEIEALDWTGYLSDQELGILPVQETKKANQALTTALTSFPIQPIATDFDTGVQTFLLVFDTESPKSTMASFFQKMCRNELGRVYSKGNGTLRFEKQGARALITYPDFELDGVMTEFITSYERSDVFNIIQATITPVEASLLPDVLLWDCKVAEYFGGVIPSIAAGETLILNCPFTDPALNTTISAINVVDPIVNIEFGSLADFESNDMIGSLAFSQAIGASATIVTMTNNHATDTGYLNDLQIYGRALYTYGNQTLEARDQASIDSGIGERRFVLRLEEITDVDTALAFAVIVKDRYCDPHIRARRINFLANQAFEVLHGAIAIEPSTRFSAIESVTGISKDFYVNRVKYTVRGPWLWVDVLADPVRI